MATVTPKSEAVKKPVKKKATASLPSSTGRKSTVQIAGLPYWKEWCDHFKSLPTEELQKLGTIPSDLSRTNARIRLAASFKGMDLDGYTKLTRLGYEAVLRLMLSYSAAEALGSAIKKRILDWQMTDEKLATELRKMFIQNHAAAVSPKVYDASYRPLILTVSPRAKKNLDEFQKGKHHNVRVPATALRNFIAHGSLTVNFLYEANKDSVNALNGLSAKLLNTAGDEFTQWLVKKGVIC